MPDDDAAARVLPTKMTTPLDVGRDNDRRRAAAGEGSPSLSHKPVRRPALPATPQTTRAPLELHLTASDELLGAARLR